MKEYSDPRMHSAEHILNQTMVRMFRCDRCFRAHIEKKKSKCDYRFDRPLTDEEIRALQSKVNQIIEADLPVKEEFLGREEAQAQYNLDRLPEDTGNRIRIIRVGDYDVCPCIGPHVKSTREIGAFRVLSSSFEDGVLRIRFKLGG
jgi:Ser-tRNA(Ala) deacylase AlaX